MLEALLLSLSFKILISYSNDIIFWFKLSIVNSYFVIDSTFESLIAIWLNLDD